MRTFSIIALWGCAITFSLSSCSAKKHINITSSKWQLLSVRSGESEEFLTPSEDRKPVTFSLSNEETVSGYAGCNGYSGKAEVKKQKITFSNLISMRMFCFDGMEIEYALLNALRLVDNYEVRNRTLLLKQDSVLLATFIPLQ